MPSRRRSRNKNLSTNISEVQRRLRYLERRPARTKLSDRTVSRSIITPRAVGPEEADFGVSLVKPPGSETDWELGLVNPKDGDLAINPSTGEAKVYDEETDSFFNLTDSTATTTYYQDTEPTGATSGDLWFDTDDGFKLYRYSGTSWVSVQDAAIAAAANAANAANTTANQKNRIYRQTEQPTGGTYSAGDVWFDTDSDNTMYRYATASTSSVATKSLTNNVATLTTSAPHSFVPLEQITVTGVDSVFNGTYTVTAVPNATTLRYSKTNANVATTSTSGTITNTDGWKVALLGDNALVNIGATKITAGTLDVGVIYSGNINTNQISAGTLAANVIYSGSISTGQITAGTLNSNVIYAGTLSASNITAGTLNAGVITLKSNTAATGVQQRIEINSTGFYAYDGTIETVAIRSDGTVNLTGSTLSTGTITGTGITGSWITTPGYPSGTGLAISSSSGGNALLFNFSGSERANIVAVSNGLVLTSGFSQLVLTAAGAVQLTSLNNQITLASAPFLSQSGANNGGAYGSLRNTWSSTATPTNDLGGDGDVWLVWT